MKKRTNMLIASIIIALGFILTLISGLFLSSFLAILGIAIIFWGSIFFYITPSKHVPLAFLVASTETNIANIERLLTEHNLDQKGIYLPPKNLQNIESSLILVPKKKHNLLPKPQEISGVHLLNSEKEGLFLTPPGSALSEFFEQKLGSSFMAFNLKDLEKKLATLLVEDLCIAENIELKVQNNIITIKIFGSILEEDCKATQKFKKTHDSIGCLLSSSWACILAKVTGKAITIKNEIIVNKLTTIEYEIMEE